MNLPTFNPAPPAPAPRHPHFEAWMKSPLTYVVMALVIFGLDYLTGPFLLFPILFVLPVALSAAYYSVRWAHAMAVLLPLGRLIIAEHLDNPAPFPYILANALIRIAVLVLLAYLVGRTVAQNRQLKQRVEGFVTICAWSRTVEYEGEWLSFEAYLKRRFGIDTSHGIAPSALEETLREWDADTGAPGTSD